MYLQSYVCPVCLYSVEEGIATIRELIGTSFFLNSFGLLVSARHVFESALSNSTAKGFRTGIVVKDQGGKSLTSVICPLDRFEAAPDPFDIAIAVLNYRCSTLLIADDITIQEWADVATLGYPIDAVSGPISKLNLNLRCLKGYVQRPLRPGDLHLGGNPPAFELSFLLGRGLSGAPLFKHAQPKDIVIGVCVGSSRTEVVEDEFTEIQADGRKYTEKRLKIDQFGVAHDMRPLLDWKPGLLAGISLREASARG
jgi:hypothetical protein